MENKLDFVDSLRGIAVLGVLLVHTGANTFSGTLNQAIGLGAKGVQLFYFISAFTLFLSCNRRSGQEKSPVRDFFLRRFFRIAPLYYCGIIFYVFTSFIIDNRSIGSIGIILNFAFLHGFSPLYINSVVPGGWSIGVEMLFYLFVPFLTVHIKNIRSAIVFLLISLVFRVLCSYFFRSNPFNVGEEIWTNYLYWYLPNQMPIFFIGIIFYFLFKGKYKIVQILPWFILILSLCTLDKLFFNSFAFNFDFIFTIGFLIIGLLLSRYRLRIVVNSFTRLIGQLSYSMYIIHFAVVNLVGRINPFNSLKGEHSLFTFIFSLILVLAITLVLSCLTYIFIEQKSQKLLIRVINSLNRRSLLFRVSKVVN